jgi:FkbM family methyltransferase
VFFYQDYTKFFDVKKGDTVFDIGAHIGSFSLYAAKKAGSSGGVYSFEPCKESFDLLSKNKKINNLENLKIFNLAVSNKGGIKKFFISNSGNQAANSLFEINNAKEVKVSVISFENFLKQNKIKTIDFLKMDCEGGEYDILFNSSKKTMQKIKKISLEYHPIDNKKNKFTIINFLRKHNFLIKEGDYFGGPGILYAIKKDENRYEKKFGKKRTNLR